MLTVLWALTGSAPLGLRSLAHQVTHRVCTGRLRALPAVAARASPQVAGWPSLVVPDGWIRR